MKINYKINENKNLLLIILQIGNNKFNFYKY